MANVKALEGAPTGSRPLNMLLRLFGRGHDQEKSDSDAQLRLLEEGTATYPDYVDAQTQTPDLAMTHAPGNKSNMPQQDLHKNNATSYEHDGNPHPYNIGSNMLDNGKHISSCASSLNESQSRSKDLEDDTDGAAPVDPRYPEENRLVVVEDFISLFLTEEAINRLGRIIGTSRALQRAQAKYEEAKGQASIGQSYIKNAESQLNDPTIPVQLRHQIIENMEHRKPDILKDIQRRKDLKQEYNIQKCSLDYLRSQSDGIFEQILSDAGVLEEPEDQALSPSSHSLQGIPEIESKDAEVSDLIQEPHVFQNLPDMVSVEAGIHKIGEIGDPVDETSAPRNVLQADDAMPDIVSVVAAGDREARPRRSKSELLKAQEETSQAWEALQAAGRQFDEREAAYEKDIAQHANGPQFSKLDIDLFHVQLGRQLTQNLREAQDTYDQARAHAKALGILADSVVSDAETVYDDGDDGYRESQDPAQYASTVDRDIIEAWATEVDISQDPPSPSTSNVEWEAESVNMSDSCSTCANNPRQRRWIDRWHRQQQSLREAGMGVEE